MRYFAYPALLTIALILSAAVQRVQNVVDLGPLQPHVFLAAVVTGLIILSGMALALRKRQGFDLILASESIVAYGIFSLVTGLAITVFLSQQSNLRFSELSAETLVDLLWPFLEGMVTAALCPFLALVVRGFENTESPSTSDPVGGGNATAEFARLSKRLVVVCEKFEGLETVLTGLSQSIKDESERISKANEELAATIETGASGLKDPLDSFGTRLQSASSKAKTDIESFGTTIKDQAEELKTKVEPLKAQLAALATAVNDSQKPMSDLGPSATDARVLLDGLSSLIKSVEKFIKPDQTA